MAGQKFISFEPDIPTRKAIDKILKDHNVEVQTVMEFDNIETVKRAVEIEAGISIVPQATVIQEVAKQTLAEVEVRGRGTLPSAGRDLQKEQGPVPGHEAVPPHLEGMKGNGKIMAGKIIRTNNAPIWARVAYADGTGFRCLPA